jgi:ATPase subunit of ABC transporter with duplicated ATPase domains
MLTINNLAKAYGARSLFEGVSLKLVPGARYGLVGANGSGKTTFLNMLSGDEVPTDGSVSIPKTARMGVLRQDRFLRDDERILDIAMQGDTIVWGALEEQRALERGAGDPSRVAELEEIIRVHDGYTLEARAAWVLEGLGIPVPKQKQPLATLSGGFKLRVLLAQVLLGGPDVLLLDEPTNHLDILSIRWLEKFLAAHTGSAVVISHDQRFLDNIATHVLDVDYGTITLYTGNYTTFAAEKVAIRERKEAEIDQVKAVIAHKQEFVDRFRYKATKANQAQSRIKQIDKLASDLEELADSSRRAPRFIFAEERPSGRDVLTIEGLSKSYGEHKVLTDVSLVVRRGDRLAIIGANGLGKSTLLKIAVGALAPNAGDVRWGHEARVGYFAQDHREILTDPEGTPLAFVEAAKPKEGPSFARGHLGRVLFSGEDVYKRIASLSGGEAARLVFGRLAAEQPNVLVLDEPTNHLDLESIDALINALSSYPGTILFVSHDRHFVARLATRVLEITADGPRDFLGTYDEYLARAGDDHLDAETVVLRAKKDKAPAQAAATSASGSSWEEQKKKRNRQKELPARRDKAMAAIEAAEARKSAIHDLYAKPGFFEKTPQAEIDALVKEEAAIGASLEGLYAEWEAAETELASLASEPAS